MDKMLTNLLYPPTQFFSLGLWKKQKANAHQISTHPFAKWSNPGCRWKKITKIFVHFISDMGLISGGLAASDIRQMQCCRHHEISVIDSSANRRKHFRDGTLESYVRLVRRNRNRPLKLSFSRLLHSSLFFHRVVTKEKKGKRYTHKTVLKKPKILDSVIIERK